jgi:hypothetical protein
MSGNRPPAGEGKATIAIIVALASIGRGEEPEGMIAAQLLAAHGCSMESYRRAIIGERTFSDANKLSHCPARCVNRTSSSREGSDARRA